MKNFKLLLATTAILSAGALIAKADDPETTTLNVHVGLAMVDKIVPIEDIEFGTILLSSSAEEQSISAELTPEGSYQVIGSGEMVGEAHSGKVSVTMRNSSPKTIQLPESIELENYDGMTLTFYPTSAEIDSDTGTERTKKIYGIGGTFSVDDINPVAYIGEYTSKLTVTLIADTGEASGD